MEWLEACEQYVTDGKILWEEFVLRLSAEASTLRRAEATTEGKKMSLEKKKPLGFVLSNIQQKNRARRLL